MVPYLLYCLESHKYSLETVGKNVNLSVRQTHCALVYIQLASQMFMITAILSIPCSMWFWGKPLATSLGRWPASPHLVIGTRVRNQDVCNQRLWSVMIVRADYQNYCVMRHYSFVYRCCKFRFWLQIKTIWRRPGSNFRDRTRPL